MSQTVPFNSPFHPTGTDEKLITAIHSGHTAGDGPSTKEASELLSKMFLGSDILLTPSCTHALELAVRLLNPRPGDEIVVPSYTFTSTANAIVLAGATPVFVDVEPLTQNIDISAVEEAISERTIAVFCINYAGIAPDIPELRKLCSQRNLMLLEDNAHGLGAATGQKPLGTFGSLGTQSFHETKNIQCGEGGCLVINDPSMLESAEILREKGTNRARFFRGQVDKYTWVSEGSSWLLADVLAAVLAVQLQNFDHIQQQRQQIWDFYHESLQDWSASTSVEIMHVPSTSTNPYHMFYLVLPSLAERSRFIEFLKIDGVFPAFHYQPLHSSEAGVRYGRTVGSMTNTKRAADRLVRLPLWAGMSQQQREQVVYSVSKFKTE